MMPKHVSGVLRDLLYQSGVAAGEGRILFLGWSYKAGVGDARETPAEPLSKNLIGAGISVSIGHGLGVLVYAFLSTLGLALLITQSDLVFSIVQLIGAVFLAWIAFRIITGSKNQKTELSGNRIRESYIRDSRFFEGFLVAILNPKIAVFFTSLFSQFLVPGQSIFVHSVMALLAGGIDTVVYCGVVFLASTKKASELLSVYQREVGLVFGILLGFLALSLFFSLIFK